MYNALGSLAFWTLTPLPQGLGEYRSKDLQLGLRGSQTPHLQLNLGSAPAHRFRPKPSETNLP